LNGDLLISRADIDLSIQVDLQNELYQVVLKHNIDDVSMIKQKLKKEAGSAII